MTTKNLLISTFTGIRCALAQRWFRFASIELGAVKLARMPQRQRSGSGSVQRALTVSSTETIENVYDNPIMTPWIKQSAGLVPFL
jgi:hypothetical protein